MNNVYPGELCQIIIDTYLILCFNDTETNTEQGYYSIHLYTVPSIMFSLNASSAMDSQTAGRARKQLSSQYCDFSQDPYVILVPRAI